MLKNKTVVIGVSGGIAVYKACDVVSRLKKLNANVHVIMTKNAKEFVTPLTFQSLSQNYVVSDMFNLLFDLVANLYHILHPSLLAVLWHLERKCGRSRREEKL